MSMTRINSPAVTARTTDVYSPNAWRATVTAPGVDGYTFVCWTHCSSVGWVGSAYVANPTAETSEVWTPDSWPEGKAVRCTALYVRS